MLQEEEAIPYSATALLGERLLVLAPHPDDEVIGCGGVVAHHLRDGRRVKIVVVTDGCAATELSDADAYRVRREQETRAGVAALGEGAEIEFLRFPDRGVSTDVIPRMRELLLGYQPDLILVPSLVEIHPDHAALSRAFCELLQSDEELVASIAVARVAFYEVSNTLRPTALVDITAVAEDKYEAIRKHESQTTIRDYVAFARGLNSYRAMTLPREVQFAEAYRVVTPQEVHTTPISKLRQETGLAPVARVADEALPVSVIVRTKNRPALLKEAIDSIRATGYPASIIVVNDGGTPPETGDGVTLISHETSRGRSEAANAGVRAARTGYVAFLDDDDLYYPEHLDVLTRAARGGTHVACYTDAVSVYLRVGSDGAYEPASRLRTFVQDYDPALLLVDNYIPLPTLLLKREDFLAAGGFDPAFDLFEDWDFLIRLSRKGPMLRVPNVTVEVRHFVAGDSIILAAPGGSDAFTRAKLQVWEKHKDLVTPHVFATAIEAQKRRINEQHSRAIEETGRRTAAEREITRFTREKDSLLNQLSAANQAASERLARIQELDQTVGRLHSELGEHERLGAERDRAIDERDRTIRELQQAGEERANELRVAYAEIGRLQGLLDLIFGSKTWKVHRFVEKLRGR